MKTTIEELQRKVAKVVWRSLPVATCRALEPEDPEMPPMIEGHAAMFNAMSEDLGGFRERIMPGAFKRTLKNGADVRALFNHDPNYVLGRNKAGTLTLAEDLEGLRFQVNPPETQWANDLMTSMKRGDISNTSFQFRAIKDRWLDEEGTIVRELLEAHLYDVSVVTFPAYTQPSAMARSLGELLGQVVDLSDPESIRSAITKLQAYLPNEEGSEPAADDPDSRSTRLKHFRRILMTHEASI